MPFNGETLHSLVADRLTYSLSNATEALCGCNFPPSITSVYKGPEWQLAQRPFPTKSILPLSAAAASKELAGAAGAEIEYSYACKAGSLSDTRSSPCL